ncbi:MAG: hypothetical protein ABSG15_01600 [FCB group bacterium]|jgi:hypothetical protein
MIKKLLNTLLILFFLCGSANIVFGQGQYNLDNKGGTIINKGTIKLNAGQVRGLPDTLGGRFEFLSNYKWGGQSIPTINFNQLVLKNQARKDVGQVTLSDGRKIPVTTFDSLIVSDSVVVTADSNGFDARAAVLNTAVVQGVKDVRMVNDVGTQEIQGNGHFSNLNIDNPNGVDIVKQGGFRINTKLELTRGEFRNRVDSNFIMSDSTWIIRHTQGSLSIEPQLGNTISVRFVGNGPITSGPELPNDSSKLQVLRVENTGGVTLSKNVTANDTIYVGTKIYTELNNSNTFVLTSTSLKDPVFGNADAEIDGSFRRTKLLYDNTKLIFNNPYTYAIFKDSASANGATELTFRIKPRTFPPIINGEINVMRMFTISAVDVNYNPVTDNLNLIIGYGWRYSVDDTKDETLTLKPNFDILILRRLNRNAWEDNLSSVTPPQLDKPNEWGYSFAATVPQLGDFAVGMPGGKLLLSGRVMLEGPYRFGSMAMDLKMKNLIPTTPPDIYPYNLDPNRSVINVPVLPDSIVDYIVLEFRKTLTDNKPYFRTCFLKVDGNIVDLDGKSPVVLARGGINPGDYFIAVRHRNHLSVITEDTVNLYPTPTPAYVDFSDPNILLGRTNAVKPIGLKIDGSVLFGLIAGDTNGDGKIDAADQLNAWNDRDYEGYLISDINMSGIINTRDFNYVWNNRGRVTLVP